MTETSPVPSDAQRGVVVVGLGANLGSARRTLILVARRLAALFPEDFRVSALYRSEPIGPAQPDFWNAAVAFRHGDPLGRLLDVTRRLEDEFGRVRAERWGPRTLDLDLLWAGERVVESDDLIVPHRELERRAFAMLPLLDVVPDARRPNEGLLYREALDSFRSQRIERVREPGWEADEFDADTTAVDTVDSTSSRW